MGAIGQSACAEARLSSPGRPGGARKTRAVGQKAGAGADDFRKYLELARNIARSGPASQPLVARQGRERCGWRAARSARALRAGGAGAQGGNVRSGARARAVGRKRELRGKAISRGVPGSPPITRGAPIGPREIAPRVVVAPCAAAANISNKVFAAVPKPSALCGFAAFAATRALSLQRGSLDGEAWLFIRPPFGEMPIRGPEDVWTYHGAPFLKAPQPRSAGVLPSMNDCSQETPDGFPPVIVVARSAYYPNSYCGFSPAAPARQ